MKENMDRGLIDDEDSEGGEEPDLIANHPVGDIVDRQFRDVADLHIDVLNAFKGIFKTGSSFLTAVFG